MTGIVACGGLGKRLLPVTKVLNKHLLLVYDKPMIYYPLATLKDCALDKAVIVSTEQGVKAFKTLLDGENLGMEIQYAVQNAPRGTADVLLAAREATGEGGSIVLILGDNVFLGDGMKRYLQNAREKVERDGGAVIFTKETEDVSSYGVLETNEDGKAVGILEKPKSAKSRRAITGLYFYDSRVMSIAERLSPSPRGEVEICDVNREYMRLGCLDAVPLAEDVVWQDAGTPDRLLAISNAAASIISGCN